MTQSQARITDEREAKVTALSEVWHAMTPAQRRAFVDRIELILRGKR